MDTKIPIPNNIAICLFSNDKNTTNTQLNSLSSLDSLAHVSLFLEYL